MNTKENIFGERLRLLRAVKGNKTQKDFAQELDIPQPTLSSYESGRIKPTVDVLINIAEKCGVSLDWLCGRDDTLHLESLGDVLSCFMELYETQEFSIKTIIHDRVDGEEREATDDAERNWIGLKIYINEVWRNPECTLNEDLCKAISTAYSLTQKLRRFECDQETYQREKTFFIENMKNVPITKIDHSDIPAEEQRMRMMEFMKEEWESMKKTGD